MILAEEEKSESELVACVGLLKAIPPSWAGRARRSRSEPFSGGLPVSAGISFVLMFVSRVKRLGPMPGMVRER